LEKIPSDRRTMEIMSKLANSIDPEVQTSFDVPSYFEDGNI